MLVRKPKISSTKSGCFIQGIGKTSNIFCKPASTAKSSTYCGPISRWALAIQLTSVTKTRLADMSGHASARVPLKQQKSVQVAANLFS